MGRTFPSPGEPIGRPGPVYRTDARATADDRSASQDQDGEGTLRGLSRGDLHAAVRSPAYRKVQAGVCAVP